MRLLLLNQISTYAFKNKLLLFLIVNFSLLFLSACSTKPYSHSVNEMDYARLEKLLEFNDLNERAFAYHQHCISKSEQMNPMFSENFEQGANLLLNTSIEVKGWKPEYAIAQILERREGAQNFLDVHYQENGCYSPEAFTAKKHYNFLSQPMTIK